MLYKCRNNGIIFLETLLGLFILLVSVTTALYGLHLANGRLLATLEKGVAVTQATELLEILLSLTNIQLATFLSGYPSTASPYPLCAHMNIEDNSGNVLNPHSIADLDSSQWLHSRRFYQVIVVNSETLQPKQVACDLALDPPAIPCGINADGTRYALCPEDKLQVTVGVLYESRLLPAKRRITITSIIPEV